jgi:signal transduction histidine kinase
VTQIKSISNSDKKIALLRHEDLIETSKKAILYIAIPVVIGAFYVDIILHGVDLCWVILRFGILPVGLFAVWLLKFSLFRRIPQIPIFLVAFYIAAFHAFFVSQTGFGSSQYFHVYLQINLILAMLPLPLHSYLVGAVSIIGIFIATSLFGGDSVSFGALRTNSLPIVVYSLLSLATFFVIQNLRFKGYLRQVQLDNEIDGREKLIENQAEELANIRVKLKVSDMKNTFNQELSVLYAQLAHDIRSPLFALESILKDASGLPADTMHVFHSVIGRIKSIADDLLSREKSHLGRLRALKYEGDTYTNLTQVISSIIREKRVQYNKFPEMKIELLGDLVDTSVLIGLPSNGIKRVLSNLIENSVDAISRQGIIQIRYENKGQNLIICVVDNGPGIPEDVLKKLPQRGFSYSKASGSGLGLFDAFEKVKNWGGEISITSKVGVGTKVTIVFPRPKESPLINQN